VDSLCVHCGTVVFRADTICRECGGPAPSSGWPRLSEVEDPWLGKTVLDDLLVMRRLGQGTTAVVYCAQSLELPRRFALKIIDLERSGSTPEQNLATARREVDIAGRLRNPHIVRIYEMERLNSRYVGVVMDYVAGEDLRNLVGREGPLAPVRAVNLIRQVANGLHEAHQAGIIHRVIKPENLLLQTLPSGEDFVRISDFGIASPARSGEGDGFVGTPLWASPEQIMGEPLDPRSDLYSIGGLFYYLLTGDAPFSRGNYMTIMRAHLHTAAPSLRDAGVRRFSEALEQVVATLLRKRPCNRPSDLLELLTMLDDLERSPDWERFVELESAPSSLVEDSETIEQSPPPEEDDAEQTELVLANSSYEFALLRRGRVAIAGQEIRLITLNPGRSEVLERGAADIRAFELTESAVLVGDGEGAVRRLDPVGEPATIYRDADNRSIVAVAADPSERVVAIGTSRGGVHLRFAERCGGRSHDLRGAPLTSLAVDREAGRLAIARRNGAVEIRDTTSPGEVETTIDVYDVTQLQISDDGHMLGVLQRNGRASVWAIDTGRKVFEARRTRGEIVSIHFGAESLFGLCRQDSRLLVVDLHGQRSASGSSAHP
jgi:serine/threonine protein kinase